MVTNALNARHRVPRPPLVCHSAPYPPPDPLVLFLECDPWIVQVNGLVHVKWYGDNPAVGEGVDVRADWDIGTGLFFSPPATLNQRWGTGKWYAPEYPGLTQLKVKCTWPDDTVAFAYAKISVVSH